MAPGRDMVLKGDAQKGAGDEITCMVFPGSDRTLILASSTVHGCQFTPDIRFGFW